MLATVIRNFSRVAYKHPVIPENRRGVGPFGNLKVAVLADYFTSVSLAWECRVRSLKPDNYREILLNWRPDLVFVESAFHGVGDEWRYKLEKQPLYMRLFGPREIRDIARVARDRGVPAIFWNKDDKAFFDAFIDVAKYFRYVFTTDSDCLPRYEAALPQDSVSGLLAMAYQPAFHNFNGFDFSVREACFVGSYYRKILKFRRDFLDMIFNACVAARARLNVYDRNSSRMSHFFEFRFPDHPSLKVRKGVPYPETARLYKTYAISINVNSVTDSPTMLSRRLLEILACGGVCVTNDTPSVQREFASFCHVVDSSEAARETLGRLRDGPSRDDLEKAEAGALYVAKRHTWRNRLEELADRVNF